MAKLKPKAQSLRNPGQSIDEEIDRVIHDDFMTFFVLALVLWVIAYFEWLGRRESLSGQFDKVALRLNQRPRETLGFKTPAYKLHASVASTH